MVAPQFILLCVIALAYLIKSSSHHCSCSSSDALTAGALPISSPVRRPSVNEMVRQYGSAAARVYYNPQHLCANMGHLHRHTPCLDTPEGPTMVLTCLTPLDAAPLTNRL